MLFLLFIVLAVRGQEGGVHEELARTQMKMTLTDLISALLTNRSLPDSLNNVDENEFYTLTFPLLRLIWSQDRPKMELPRSTCDIVMEEYSSWDLFQSPLEHRVAIECIRGRLNVDFLRYSVKELHSLPVDLLTNPLRKYVFAKALIKSFLVYYQYVKDQGANFTVVQSLHYQNLWKSVGLITSHYEKNAENEKQWHEFCRSHSEEDYMLINGAEEGPMARFLFAKFKQINTIYQSDSAIFALGYTFKNFIEGLIDAIQ